MASKVLGGVLAGLLCTAAFEAEAANGRYWTEAKASRVRRQHSEVAKVARKAMPAVVSITTRDEPAAGESGEEPHKGLGSGFIIHPDGYILTAAHVIEGSSEITVSMLDAVGRSREYRAEVVGQDSQTDAALLKIDAGRKLPVLKLGTSKRVDVADWVVVIGNPFGLSHSVSVGVVSFKGRSDVTPSGRNGFFDFLQTDASINPGNSGGPMLDIHGEVVAVANAVNVAGQGIGFAVPIDMVKEILPQLYAHGAVQRGWIGISVQDLTTEQARKVGARSMSGVLVSDVVEGGPAARAGLRTGDVILGLGRLRVDRAHALRWKVANSGVGREVELKVARRGKPMKLKVRLEDVPAADEGTDAGLARASTKPSPNKGQAKP
jgi:serine protease Do